MDVRFESYTVWLTQAQLIELYYSSKANVSEHIKHIFEDGELNQEGVVRKFRTTATHSEAATVQNFRTVQKEVDPGAFRRLFVQIDAAAYHHHAQIGPIANRRPGE